MRLVTSITITAACFLCHFSIGQNSIYGKYISNKKIEFHNNKLKSTDFFEVQNKSLGLGIDDEMKLEKSWNDKTGISRKKYKQYYKGIPVVGGTYALHIKNGFVNHSSGSLFPYINVNIKDNVTIPVAANKAILNTKLKLEDEQTIEKAENVSWSHDYHGLTILDAKYPEVSGNYRLAHSYIVQSEAYEIPIKYQVYVDAHTGEQLQIFNLIKCGSVKGIARTRYYGEQEITTDSIAPDLYLMRDMTRGDGIVTLDYNTDFDTIRDNDNIWGNEHNHRFDEIREVAGDAHYCSTKYYDMMQDYFNWDGLDGQGSELVSVVNFFGKFFVNAFWNGESTNYGNGDCSRYGPLTTMTVVGHEFAHGWTDFTSNLIYYKESGALNESISDIMGKGLEYYADKERFSWKIGDLIRLNDDVNVFRSMSDPHERFHPKYYGGINWRTGDSDAGGVHSNSGVLNYWFYLLVEGESGINEKSEFFDVSSIGMRNALDIIFVTQTAYLTESSNYIDFFYSSIQATKDLFGRNSAEMRSVEEAWKATGLFAGIDDFDFAIEILDGDISLCADEEFYIEAIIRNAGRQSIKANTAVELTFLQRLSQKVTEPYTTTADLLPGESFSYKFKTPIINDHEKNGNYTVSIEANDIYKLNNTDDADLFISELQNLDLELRNFELLFGNDCDSQLSRYRINIQNLGCLPVPQADRLIIDVATDQGDFEIDLLLFSELEAGNFLSRTGFLVDNIPDNISSYSATLMYRNDDNVNNNIVTDGQVVNIETITTGYKRDFEATLANEKFRINLDDNFNIDTVVNYKGNNMLSFRSNDNVLRLQGCNNSEDFFDTYSRKARMMFCVDAIGAESPIFSFDMLKLSNRFRDAELPDEQFGSMVRVSLEEEVYPIIYEQTDDILLQHKFDLPENYSGLLEIEILTLFANSERNDFNLKNLDVVMLDNIRLYDESDVQLMYDDYGYNVSPNPVDDLLRVESNDLDKPYDVYLFDRVGRLMSQTFNNQNITMINMEEMPQGIYFVTILHYGNIITTQKIVKI